MKYIFKKRINLRVKVVSEHVVKAYGGKWLITPLFLNLGTRWISVVIFIFLPKDETWALCGTHSLSVCSVTRNCLCPCRQSNHDSSVVQLVALFK